MSVLDQVRAKFKVSTEGTSRTSKSPSAGFEVPLHTHLSAQGGISAELESRIRAMAARWGFPLEELAEELDRAAADPSRALLWVERDERTFGTGETLNARH